MKRLFLMLFPAFLIVQLYSFPGVLGLYFGQEIQANGLVCTCPDMAVISGEKVLKSCTPDSLKNQQLDYSEIWLTEQISTPNDLMGGKQYFLKGEVVGKQRVSAYDAWNPIVRVDALRVSEPVFDYVFRLFFLLELVVFLRLAWKIWL